MKDRAILFGNGDYAAPDYYQKLIGTNYIVAIDGGLNYLNEIGVKPDLILGDFDSADPKILDLFSGVEQIKHPVHKDFTDTELGLNEVIKRGIKNIDLVGMSGGRVDHWLSNLLLLKKYAQEGVNLKMLSPEETLFCCKGPSLIELSEPINTKVSLIPMTPEVKGITLTGFEYPLEKATLSQKSPGQGVSNITIKTSQTIEFKSGILLIILEYK